MHFILTADPRGSFFVSFFIRPELCRAASMYFLFFFLSLFIYFERDRACEWGRDREREGEREKESQVGSTLSAQSLTRGSNS